MHEKNDLKTLNCQQLNSLNFKLFPLCCLMFFVGITKSHWQFVTYNGTHCSNSECSKKVKRVVLPAHHCYRCGKLFCKKCLSYKRRLNQLAHPDPNGRMYKVRLALLGVDVFIFLFVIWINNLVYVYLKFVFTLITKCVMSVFVINYSRLK